jgi:hypothetical protein
MKVNINDLNKLKNKVEKLNIAHPKQSVDAVIEESDSNDSDEDTVVFSESDVSDFDYMPVAFKKIYSSVLPLPQPYSNETLYKFIAEKDRNSSSSHKNITNEILLAQKKLYYYSRMSLGNMRAFRPGMTDNTLYYMTIGKSMSSAAKEFENNNLAEKNSKGNDEDPLHIEKENSSSSSFVDQNLLNNNNPIQTSLNLSFLNNFSKNSTSNDISSFPSYNLFIVRRLNLYHPFILLYKNYLNHFSGVYFFIVLVEFINRSHILLLDAQQQLSRSL